MPGKRNDAEGNTAEREMTLTRTTSALVIVLMILFWATAPAPGSRSIQFSIQGSLGGDAACAGSHEECAEGAEVIHPAMPQEFDVSPAMSGKVLADPDQVSKQISLRWWPKRLTTTIEEMDVRAGHIWRLVVFVSGQTTEDEEETDD